MNEILVDPYFEKRVLRGLRTQTAVAFKGPPGVGKTVSVFALGAKHNFTVDVVLTSLRDYQDFMGWPLPSRKPEKVGDTELQVVRYAPPAFAVRAANAGPSGHIIFMDELNNGNITQQALALRLILEKVCGEIAFDQRRVAIIASYNPPDLSSGGIELSYPMTTRFKHHDFDANREFWLKGFPSYWGNAPKLGFGKLELSGGAWAWARSLVTGYLQKMGPDVFHKIPDTEDERTKPSPNPRTWDMASRQLADVKHAGEPLVEALADIIGCIGKHGQAFMSWVADKDLRDPEEVIAEEVDSFNGTATETHWKRDKPSPFNIPRRGDVAYPLVSTIAAAVVHDLTPARGVAVWRVMKACAEQGAKEVAASAASEAGFFREWSKKAGSLPKVSEEIKPYVAFLRKTGLLQDRRAETAEAA
jgi:hypothetical protein